MNTLAPACPAAVSPTGCQPLPRREWGKWGKPLFPLPVLGVSDSPTSSDACEPMGQTGKWGKVWTGKASGASTGG
jgi:hypothetical protein